MAIWIIGGLFVPLLPIMAYEGSGIEQPQTVEEAKGFGLEILKGLPGAVKELWQEEVVPLWQKMWDWFKEQLTKLWNWFLGLLGREVERIKPEIEEKIEEKVEETKQTLWQRFKGLFK